MSDYRAFLIGKQRPTLIQGFQHGEWAVRLYEFQRSIVARAITLGRAAIFADCGLGKTPMQLEWADQVHRQTGRPVLILAPLAVAEQTASEGRKFGVHVDVCRRQSDCGAGVNVANYEMLQHFDAGCFAGIVLDESSILKAYEGKMRRDITDFGRRIQYRLACTATPAPNDWTEIINHAEFLGVMSGKEIIATYFIQDGNTTQKYRLKRHAVKDFWAWVASWAIAIRKPSDLGFDDGGFTLPPIRVYQHTVDSQITDGMLFPVLANTLQGRRLARRESLDDRVKEAAALANGTDKSFLLWCDLNAESEALCNAVADAVEVRGSDSSETKASRLIGFSEGRHRVLVTKPTIAGFSMNWQHCNQMAFVGLSDSFEQMYQAIRRCWRFGQQNPVDVHLICAENEGAVLANVRRKEAEHAEMMENIIANSSHDFILGKTREMEYRNTTPMELPNFLSEVA
mgnify:CR=1 FL=1